MWVGHYLNLIHSSRITYIVVELTYKVFKKINLNVIIDISSRWHIKNNRLFVVQNIWTSILCKNLSAVALNTPLLFPNEYFWKIIFHHYYIIISTDIRCKWGMLSFPSVYGSNVIYIPDFLSINCCFFYIVLEGITLYPKQRLYFPNLWFFIKEIILKVLLILKFV